MSGTEYQRSKEDQAAIMRAKQAAGKTSTTLKRWCGWKRNLHLCSRCKEDGRGELREEEIMTYRVIPQSIETAPMHTCLEIVVTFMATEFWYLPFCSN